MEREIKGHHEINDIAMGKGSTHNPGLTSKPSKYRLNPEIKVVPIVKVMTLANLTTCKLTL